MLINSVKINNYKSIGDKQNELILSETLTPIIGKNGSGKTNILKALAEIDLKNKMPNTFVDKNSNRINDTEEHISYLIELIPTPNEIESFEILDCTTIFISKDKYIIKGGLLKYYELELKNTLNNFLKELGENPLNLPDKQLVAYNDKIKPIKDFDLFKIKNTILYINNSLSNKPLFTEYKAMFEEIKESLSIINSMLPDFIFVKEDKKLASEYTLQVIKDELTTKDNVNKSLLKNLFQLIDYDETKFINLVTTYGSSKSMNTKKQINKKIEKCINKPFREFYKNENIKLVLEMIRGKVNFLVSGNDGPLIDLSEKSEGLQWYLNAFVYLKSNNLPMKNVVFLLDEPGKSLHINAQDNLLTYLKHLTEKNQIVYATHSPYMISNTKINLGDIRLIEKNKDGYTQIFSSLQSYKIEGPQSETLTPLIKCIGMNLNNTIGPSLNKINLITEGISDYYYIKALANILNFDLNSYNIIPSIGANNVMNICCILIGWGCKYIAIFDYDKEGVNHGGKNLEKLLKLELNKNYIYLKDTDKNEIQNSDFLKNPVTIEDLITSDELDSFIKDQKDSNGLQKYLLSKFYFDSVTKQNNTYTEKCKDNFNNLFTRIRNIKFE
jgi:predicted ATP-dependent endonuclease of OLD family